MVTEQIRYVTTANMFRVAISNVLDLSEISFEVIPISGRREPA